MSVHICVRYNTIGRPSLIFYTDQENNTLPNNTTFTTLCTNKTISIAVKSKVCIQFKKFYSFSISSAETWLIYCRYGVKLYPISQSLSLFIFLCYALITAELITADWYLMHMFYIMHTIHTKKPGRYIFVMFITMISVFLLRWENIYLFNCAIRLTETFSVHCMYTGCLIVIDFCQSSW